MQAPDTSVVLLEEDKDWATVWLNRPEARNAMSDELMSELQAVFDYLKARDDIRGITVRGKGEAFCAGGDLKGFKNNFQAVRSDEEVVQDSSKMGNFFLTVRSMPQVIIFVLHGAAMAGGLGMASAADIVIAVKDTKMALTETAIGIVPAQIGRYVVARTGDVKARRIMLTGHRFSALEGADYGLVDFAVDDMAAAESQLAELVAGVRRCAPGANAATKELLEALKKSFVFNLKGRIEDGVVEIYRQLTGSRFPFNEKKFRDKLKPIIEHGNNPFAQHGAAVGASPDRTSRLHEIQVPTLVIHGTEDAILPLDHGIAVADGITDSKRMIMEGVGHEIPEELLPEIIKEIVSNIRRVSLD